MPQLLDTAGMHAEDVPGSEESPVCTAALALQSLQVAYRENQIPGVCHSCCMSHPR